MLTRKSAAVVLSCLIVAGCDRWGPIVVTPCDCEYRPISNALFDAANRTDREWLDWYISEVAAAQEQK